MPGLLRMRKCIHIVKTLKPGQAGTKEPQKRFGPSLHFARYGYGEGHREHEECEVGHPAALSIRRSRVPQVAGARRSEAPGDRVGELQSSWGHFDPPGGTADRRSAGSGQAGLAAAARRGRAARPAATGGRCWWSDMGTAANQVAGCWNLGVRDPRCRKRGLRNRMPRCRYQVPRCRQRCLDVGTA